MSPSGLQPLKPLGRHMPRASVAALAGAAAVAVSLAALSWGEEDIPRHTRQVHDFDPTDPKNHELSQDTQTSGSAPVGVVERVTSSARGVPKKLSRAMGVASQSASEASVDMRRALAACETLAWCLANPGLRKGMEASLGESLTLQLPQFVVDQFPKGGSRTGERGEAGDAAGELGIEAVREKVATRRLRSYSWRQRVARTVRAFTDSPETRAAVAGAGGGRVVQWLMGCLTDPDWVVKREAETAVATLLADGGTRKRTVDAEGSIGHLLAWAVQLDDSSSQVSAEKKAFRTLKGRGDEFSVRGWQASYEKKQKLSCALDLVLTFIFCLSGHCSTCHVAGGGRVHQQRSRGRSLSRTLSSTRSWRC